MKNTIQKRFTQTATAAVALMVVLSVFGPIGTVAAQEVSVEQSETEVTAAPGETVELTTTVSISDLNAHGLQVFLPGEWEGTITDADGGAAKPASGSGNPLEVVWLSLESSHEVTYEVHVPEDADEGDYTVDVDGSGIDPADDSRVVESTQTIITVEEPDQNEAPTASFTYSPDSPETGQEVSFDASGSSDDSAIASYEWDVDGDGQTDATGAQATHTFDAAGDYDAELIVTDDDGETDSATQTVSVSEDSDDGDESDDDEDDSDEDDSDESDNEDDDGDDSDDEEDADDGEDDSDEEDSDQESGEDCAPEEDESPDSDGDGLTDAEEKELGTDPHDADTDGDCVPDGDEVEAGTDPLDSNCY